MIIHKFLIVLGKKNKFKYKYYKNGPIFKIQAAICIKIKNLMRVNFLNKNKKWLFQKGGKSQNKYRVDAEMIVLSKKSKVLDGWVDGWTG